MKSDDEDVDESLLLCQRGVEREEPLQLCEGALDFLKANVLLVRSERRDPAAQREEVRPCGGKLQTKPRQMKPNKRAETNRAETV